MIAGGVVMIVLGSNLAVEGASNIALALGISQRFIGLTIVAFGTSLPELVTSVSAARKGKDVYKRQVNDNVLYIHTIINLNTM